MDAFNRIYCQNLEPSFKKHMKNIYTCIALVSLFVGVGGFLHLSARAGGCFGLLILGMSSIVNLMRALDEEENTMVRLNYFLSLALNFGLALGPILDKTISTKPEAIFWAFFTASLLFISLTVASSLYSQDHNIYLAGILLPILLYIVFVYNQASLAGSPYLWYKSQVYWGLIILSARTLYNTRMFVEEYRNGDKDYISHSAHLFLRFIEIFQCLLVILTDKAKIEQKMTLRPAK